MWARQAVGVYFRVNGWSEGVFKRKHLQMQLVVPHISVSSRRPVV